MPKTNKKSKLKHSARPMAKRMQKAKASASKINAKKFKNAVKMRAKASKPAPKQSLGRRPVDAAALAKAKQKAAEGRKKANVSIPQPDEVKEALDRLLNNERATEYLKKNVSKMAVDVISMLVTPKTDEFLAEQLAMKINAIRRILNIMQGYGITNYYISKNTKGWLSFAWYINTNKLNPFLEYIDSMEKEKSILNESCDDYFICGNCYKTDKFVFTFDSAFETNFKCAGCGKGLSRMNRDEVAVLINTKESISPA